MDINPTQLMPEIQFSFMRVLFVQSGFQRGMGVGGGGTMAREPNQGSAICCCFGFFELIG